MCVGRPFEEATTFNCDTWKVSKGAMIVAHGSMIGTLYMIAFSCGSSAVVASKEDPNLWHQRLGHMSEKGLKVMHIKGKLAGLQLTDIDLCESCIYRKQKRVSFNTGGRIRANRAQSQIKRREHIEESYQTEKSKPQSNKQQTEAAGPPVPSPVPKQTSWPRVSNKRYLNYLLLIDGDEPEYYNKAWQVQDVSKWEFPVRDKMNYLTSTKTLELVELPTRKKTLHKKWVYRVKEENSGSTRYKERWLVKDFQLKERTNYTNIFQEKLKLCLASVSLQE